MYFGISLNSHPKILIAPLDWGLGHATRCIPVITALLREGAEVVVAGTEVTNALIREEFPGLTYLYLPGYAVSYSKRAWLLPIKLLRQLPSVWQAIRNEQRWLQEVIDQRQIKAVISDNRYGLYSKKVPCVLITHQLQIQVPKSRCLQGMLNHFVHSYIRRFSRCWVPDDPSVGMAGVLSDPNGLQKISFIGNLSRFGSRPHSSVWPAYHTVFLLSGPEPQRSMLEQCLIDLSREWPHKVLLVRGLPGQSLDLECIHAGADRVAHLPAVALESVLCSATWIVCRSGYSTIMDLMKLGKTALLIPTPGQTEQEYLSVYLAEKGWFATVPQSEVSRNAVLTALTGLQQKSFPSTNDQLLALELRRLLHDLGSE